MALLLLVAVALVGVAHLAVLPPFEGFDETAHWSYLQELADTGHPPHYGRDGLARDTDRYDGPMPYNGGPPYDATRRPTYRRYRQAGAGAITARPTRYASTSAANWQAQHPPLYYALLVPAFRLAKGWGWVDQLLVLRSLSFALAYAGFAMGVATAWRLSGRVGAWAAPIVAAWPILFPQFFPEFARLGNDSLCLLLTGCAWAALARLLTDEEEQEGGWLPALGLGVALGLGLLTKAFFLPIGASVGLLLLGRWWRSGWRADRLVQAILAGATALAIGGWWYLAKWRETGSLTGSDEFIRLHQAGGWGLIWDNLSVSEFGHGLLVLATDFLWAGTWSQAQLPQVWLVAPGLLAAMSGIDYPRTLRRPSLIGLAPLVLLLPMAAGLLYHILVWMAGTSAETPGWYFHILAGPLGLAVAMGWRRPRLLGALAALTGAGALVAWAFQLSLFSGCAAKIGSDPRYNLQGASCFIDPGVLARLGHPALGATAFLGGAACVIAAAVLSLSPRTRRAAG